MSEVAVLSCEPVTHAMTRDQEKCFTGFEEDFQHPERRSKSSSNDDEKPDRLVKINQNQGKKIRQVREDLVTFINTLGTGKKPSYSKKRLTINPYTTQKNTKKILVC